MSFPTEGLRLRRGTPERCQRVNTTGSGSGILRPEYGALRGFRDGRGGSRGEHSRGRLLGNGLTTGFGSGPSRAKAWAWWDNVPEGESVRSELVRVRRVGAVLRR